MHLKVYLKRIMIWKDKKQSKTFMFNDIILDKTQVKIIKSKKKNILVLASAGSGKTLIISSKVKYLIEKMGVLPKDILCISFTNDATDKLKNDLNYPDVDVMTFHKLALKIIGKKYEILSENMLINVINDTFSNDVLYGIFNMNKDEMFYIVETFINLFKAKNYTVDKFYNFLSKANSKDKLLLNEIMKCYICYQSYLKKENLIDFNDMINIAIKKLDSSTIRYKYIIVDEYQDTSLTKFKLINKLRKLSDAYFFAVGDDFQSIYRFTGSDITIITNFKSYLNNSRIYKLRKTYRNSKELIKVAGKFIMKNPFQIRKRLNSDISIKNPIQIIYYDDLNESMLKVVQEEKIDNLFILTRNNKDLDGVKISGINYKKMTIHKSKGLQSDFVFLINLNNNKNGFPNKYTYHYILKYVNNYKQYYPYDEERRLFYVALTRCKKKVYIFAPINNPSIFVKELSKYKNVCKKIIKKE